MRKSMYLYVGLFVLVAGMIAFHWNESQAGSDDSYPTEGSMPYSPSRLEWLALELNASYRADLALDRGYMMDFLPIERENTILIAVGYMSSVDRELMNKAIGQAKKLIATRAKSKGWSSWLEIKEDIKMFESRVTKKGK